MAERTTEQLLPNLKKLQDLKFEIFVRSQGRLDFHRFGIDQLTLPEETVDLVDWYHRYKQQLTLPEIADLIVTQYHL